jgi:hypothetical protein
MQPYTIKDLCLSLFRITLNKSTETKTKSAPGATLQGRDHLSIISQPFKVNRNLCFLVQFYGALHINGLGTEKGL